MRGMILLELQQSIRSYRTSLLIIIPMVAIMKLMTGPSGPWAPFAIVLWSTASTIGVGTLGEEYSKGQLRYLFATGIRRRTVWIVKLTSGILGVLTAAAIIGPVAWIVPSPLPVDGVDLIIALNMTPIGGIACILSLGLMAYATGLAAMGFARRTNTALFFCMGFSSVPLVLLVLASVLSGSVPSVAAVMTYLLTISAVLLAAATLLFFLRNAFIDQPWRWAATGVGTAGVTAFVALIAVTTVTLALPGASFNTLVGPPLGVQIFPAHDGEHAIVTKTYALGAEHRVVDRNGHTVRELPANTYPFHGPFPDRLGFSPTADRVLYHAVAETPGIMSRQTRDEPPIGVLNLQSGEVQTMPRLVDGDANWGRYERWTDDGRYLIGLLENFELETTQAFRQSVDTGEIERRPVIDADEIGYAILLNDGRTAALLSDEDTGLPMSIRISGWGPDDRPVTLTLPPDTQGAEVHPDGTTVLLTRQEFSETHVTQIVETLSVASGETERLLGPPTLTPTPLAEVARGNAAHVHATFSPAGRWIVVTIHERQEMSAQLIDTQTKAVTRLPKRAPGMGYVGYGYYSFSFSPLETRGFVVVTPDDTPAGGSRETTTQLRIFALDRETPEVLLDWTVPENVYSYQWWGEDALMYVEQPDEALPTAGLVLDVHAGAATVFPPEPVSGETGPTDP
ncbi:MAG: hypothetical protein AAF078_09450 [Planctomycetota bacterium]